MQEQKKKRFWFKIGWWQCWYPCSWQGYLVFLSWLALVIFGVLTMDHEWLKNLVVIFILTAILIWICYKKGEKPRWKIQ